MLSFPSVNDKIPTPYASNPNSSCPLWAGWVDLSLSNCSRRCKGSFLGLNFQNWCNLPKLASSHRVLHRVLGGKYSSITQLRNTWSPYICAWTFHLVLENCHVVFYYWRYVLGNIQGQAGSCSEQPDQTVGVPVYSRGIGLDGPKCPFQLVWFYSISMSKAATASYSMYITYICIYMFFYIFICAFIYIKCRNISQV